MKNNTDKTNETAVAQPENVRIEPKYKLELVTSKDATREVLQLIRIEHSERFGNVAVATQGRSMAIVPIEGDCVAEKRKVQAYNITTEALKASRKVTTSRHSDLNGQMTLNGDIKLADERRFPLPDSELRYPNWPQVLPEASAKIAFTVALNAKLLWDLAQALGSDGTVTLRFIDELSPITVTPNYNGNGEHGVLMPMRVGG